MTNKNIKHLRREIRGREGPFSYLQKTRITTQKRNKVESKDS